MRTILWGYFYLGGFFTAQGQVIALDEIFDWIAQRGIPFDEDRLTFDDAHLDETPAQRARAVNALDGGPLSRPEQVELDGSLHKKTSVGVDCLRLN
jgi:hypothetical protein